MRLRARHALIVLLAAALTMAAGPSGNAQNMHASVHFENSGDEAGQIAFQRGVELLHSFEYDRAAAAFRTAQQAEPGFAMAYWGEAMTHNHPVWQEQDLNAGRAVLRRLGKSRADRLSMAATPRERAWLEAVEILYGDGDKRARDYAYSDAMATIHATDPDDPEARAFYALSLLGLAHDGRDFALYMRAAALLEEVFPENRTHPGVLHYMIHSYDDPIHAPLGLRAARLYGKVAPDAGHALHMTSHIFVAMGMWDDVVAANLQAVDVVDRQRAANGRGSRECGHYNEWLIYGYLQRGDVDRADAQIAACRGEAERELSAGTNEAKLEQYRSSVSSHSEVSLWRLVHTGEWLDGVPLDLPEGKYLWSRFYRAYGDVLARRADPEALSAALGHLSGIVTQIKRARIDDPGSPNHAGPHQIAIMAKQAAALHQIASGETDAGLLLLRAAAQEEADLPLQFGPPKIAKPSYELLAEELMKHGNHTGARTAFEKTLETAPGRRLAKEGLAEVSGR